MATLLDFLQGLDGGQPTDGIMQPNAPQFNSNPMSALQGLTLGQNSSSQPQDLLSSILQQVSQPQQSPQSFPMQQQSQAQPALPVNNNNISNYIQQMVGAKQPAQPNMASNILANRFNSQAPQDSISLNSQATPNATNYADSINSILTGKFQTGQDIANNNMQNALIQSEINKNNAQSGGLFGANGSANAGASSGLSGDAFLSTLPPGAATQVRALAEGRMQFPGGFALKSPYWQQMISAVSQYDPNFDAVNYNARSKTYNDFTSGKSRQNLTSIDTAINTLAQLQDANDKLGGGQVGNWIRNQGLNQLSDPDLRTYSTLAKTAADEVTKAVVGGSGGGVGDREARMEALSPNQSPEARKAAINAMITELNSRLDPLAQAYTQGMGTSKQGIDLLTPNTANAYRRIMGIDPPQLNAPSQTTNRLSQVTGNTSISGNQQIQEGQTAINPQTGHRIVFTNGQWMDANGQ